MYYDNIVKGQINEYEKPLSLKYGTQQKKDTQTAYPSVKVKTTL
jgi:hypothetical protein